MKRLTKILIALIVAAVAVSAVLPECVLADEDEQVVLAVAEEESYEYEDIGLSAEAAIVVDGVTGTVLYSRDADSKMYPASLTKLMTFLTAVRYLGLGYDDVLPSAEVEVGNELDLVPDGSSKAWLTEGEHINLQYLVYGMMLPSGNDAATVLAVYIGRKLLNDEEATGSAAYNAFVELMNTTAEELGLTGSHFVNPHGWHSEEHYVTASDYVQIMIEAMKYACIREVVSTELMLYPMWTDTSEYSDMQPLEDESEVNELVALNPFDNFNYQPESRGYHYWYNTNVLLHEDSEYYMPECIGIKTGYTKSAGSCLAACVETDRGMLYSVVLDCDGSAHYSETKSLLTWAEGVMTDYEYVSADSIIASIKVAGGTDEFDLVDVVPSESVSSYIMKGTEGEVAYSITWADSIGTDGDTLLAAAPFDAGTEVGTLTVLKDGEELSTVSLLTTGGAVEAEPVSVERARIFQQDMSSSVVIAVVGGVLALLVIALHLIRKIAYAGRVVPIGAAFMPKRVEPERPAAPVPTPPVGKQPVAEAPVKQEAAQPVVRRPVVRPAVPNPAPMMNNVPVNGVPRSYVNRGGVPNSGQQAAVQRPVRQRTMPPQPVQQRPVQQRPMQQRPVQTNNGQGMGYPNQGGYPNNNNQFRPMQGSGLQGNGNNGLNGR